jgi:hypothetical protein
MTNILLLEGPDGNRYKGTQISDDTWHVKQYLNKIPSEWWKGQYHGQFYMDRTYTNAKMRETFSILAASEIYLEHRPEVVIHWD